MTVLFVELAGFGDSSGAIEPEELSQIATDFTREAVAVMIDHGGIVANITAHSMMVLFEGDQRHPPADRPMAAVRSALAMRTNCAELAIAWRRRGISGEYSLRAGLNTGFCTVGVFGSELLSCYTAVGAPVQIAARLLSTARAGQILCGMSVFSLLEGRVLGRPCQPISVEGLSRDVDTVEIESLLESGHVERPHSMRATGERPTSLLPGSLLGHYQLVKRIGKGGMGEVYWATDTRLGRAIALKLLPAQMAGDADSVQRFLQEARAIAALRHPNIVDVYSVEEAGGHHFITMELVEGDCLSDLIPQGGLHGHRLLELGLQLVEAVAGAHARGVIHRDLKPANVMVDRNSRVKVLDFGLAKLNRAAINAVTIDLSRDVVTTPGAVLGTVPYMSPEQLRGNNADHRSDIFSLGVTLYEMATGRRPFGGLTPAGLMTSILNDEPESVTTSHPDLPKGLGRIIDRCLVKDPDKRYSSSQSLLKELQMLR